MLKKLKRQLCFLFVLVMILSVTSCGNESSQSENVAKERVSSEKIEETPKVENDSAAETPFGKILIAYFTLADNYEDAGEMDAVSQASLNLEKNELVGNTEYLVKEIQEEIGGDLFSVVVKNPYPNDYDKIVDMGSEEQEENARPELSGHVENMDEYDTVFIGFPIWWYTIPQAMFTFLEEYDFSGKTIIPFATHGGYGVGSSVEDIQKLCPDANVIEDIFETERNDISGKSKEIGSWLEEIGIKK